MSKNIFIVNAFINSPEKESMVIDAITQIKKCGHKVLIVSNSILSNSVTSLCDYYLYEKEEYLLSPEVSPFKWYTYGDEIVHLYFRGNSLSVVRNLGIALNFAKHLGFEKFITLEYDNIFHDTELEKLNNIFNILDNKYAFFCKTMDGEKEWFESRIFAGDVKFFTTAIQLPKTYEDWERTPDGNATCLEHLYPFLLEPFKHLVECFQGSNEQYFPNSKIDVMYSVPLASIVYNTFDINRPILFLIGSGEERSVHINGNHIETSFMPRGTWKNYPLDISNTNYHIEVKENNKVNRFTVNKNNIETYRWVGRLFKQ